MYETLESTGKMKLISEILPVFAQVLQTLKFLFPRSHGKLFLVMLQAIIYVFIALIKCKNYCSKTLKIIRIPDFCPLKPDIARFLSDFQLT